MTLTAAIRTAQAVRYNGEQCVAIWREGEPERLYVVCYGVDFYKVSSIHSRIRDGAATRWWEMTLEDCYADDWIAGILGPESHLELYSPAVFARGMDGLIVGINPARKVELA